MLVLYSAVIFSYALHIEKEKKKQNRYKYTFTYIKGREPSTAFRGINPTTLSPTNELAVLCLRHQFQHRCASIPISRHESILGAPFFAGGGARGRREKICAGVTPLRTSLKMEQIMTDQMHEPVLYVAPDLTWWVTDEPDKVADRVVIYGKRFAKLTPEVIAWIKQNILRAERACNAGKISVEKFSTIIKAFCPVYEFAIRQCMIPDPMEKATAHDSSRGVATGCATEVAA